MGDSGAKIVIEKEFMQFELNLQNNYKDLAYEHYLKTQDVLESFYEQGDISKFYYSRMKKKLKKYEELYQSEEENNEK